MSALGSSGSTWAWRIVRRRVLDRDGWTCRLRLSDRCRGEAWTVDHIVPRVQGGTDDDDNLLAACGPCNTAKGGRPLSAERARFSKRGADTLAPVSQSLPGMGDTQRIRHVQVGG